MSNRKRRTGCALAITAALVALALGAAAFASSGWGPVLSSVLDRVVPGPTVTMWAKSPEPDSYVDSYNDGAGAYENYVYRVDAVTDEGAHRELQLIYFGTKASGSGYLEIEAKGKSGLHYNSVEQSSVPEAALESLGH